MPIKDANKTTRAMKKSGKCQTKRDRPVYSRIATTSHARRKPIGPMARIQGISKSPSCISAWFMKNKDIKERGRGASRIAIFTPALTLPGSSRWNLPEEIDLCEGEALRLLQSDLEGLTVANDRRECHHQNQRPVHVSSMTLRGRTVDWSHPRRLSGIL